MKKSGMGSHQSADSKTDEWLTPPHILKSLGTFDLDPCSPIIRPWDTAAIHYTIEDDGLSKEWRPYRVWCNPPYGLQAAKWLMKLSDHGDGIALVFARTETRMFFAHVWPKAHAVLFLEGRLFFHNVDGSPTKINCGAPSVLIAYGENNADILRDCELKGKFIKLK